MTDISPTAEQAKAIKAIVEWYGQKNASIFYLAGFAGTGKSTIVQITVKEIREKYHIKNICTAAYTGKAAAVLRRKGIEDAMTIHGLIYRPKADKNTGELQGFRINRSSAASEADLIILDECSMIDDKLSQDLLSFEKKILFIGDPGQLPPIKNHSAFSNMQPNAFLHEIIRQAADSPILELATLARQRKPLPIGYNKSNVRVEKLTPQALECIHDPATQVICGLNNVRWKRTKEMRDRLGFLSPKPTLGERLVCCKNNHTTGVMNGMMGTLTGFHEAPLTWKDKEDKEHSWPAELLNIDFRLDDADAVGVDDPVNRRQLTDPVQFTNHTLKGKAEKMPWEKGRPFLNEFDFAYAITCHKAQGSQYPHVTVIDDSHAFGEDAARWIYTAITRAESGLTILKRGD